MPKDEIDFDYAVFFCSDGFNSTTVEKIIKLKQLFTQMVAFTMIGFAVSGARFLLSFSAFFTSIGISVEELVYAFLGAGFAVGMVLVFNR